MENFLFIQKAGNRRKIVARQLAQHSTAQHTVHVYSTCNKRHKLNSKIKFLVMSMNVCLRSYTYLYAKLVDEKENEFWNFRMFDLFPLSFSLSISQSHTHTHIFSVVLARRRLPYSLFLKRIYKTFFRVSQQWTKNLISNTKIPF